MKKYTIDGQTIMIQITTVSNLNGETNSMTLPPTVFAIATTIDNAITICSTLNVFEKQFNNN